MMMMMMAMMTMMMMMIRAMSGSTPIPTVLRGKCGHDSSFHGQPCADRGQHSEAIQSRDFYTLSTAKPSGTGPKSAHLDSDKPQHKKKAYIRALKRAQLHGHTWYKGQLFTAAMLGTEQLQAPLADLGHHNRQKLNVAPPAKVRKNRLTGFSWNICSLGSYKFDILRQWMRSQHLDVLFLQDTRWGFSGDWQDSHFAYVHSGSRGKTGGLMVIIRKSFCPVDRISWRETLPGRLLHVRLYLPSSGIDLLNIYQHAWVQHDPLCLQHRGELLHACDQLLAGLPQRNVVILGGDLNTSLPHIPHCGAPRLSGPEGKEGWTTAP